MTIYNLGDTAITTALTDSIVTSASGSNGATNAYLETDGITAVTLYAEFTYGSSGTTCAVIVQTSINQGADWIDVCRFDFTTANASKVANLSGLLSKAVTAVAALASEGVTDGVLGDRLRAKITSTGTYAGNTSVSIRAATR